MAFITLGTLAEQVELLYGGGSLSRDSSIEREDIILLVKQVASRVVVEHLTAKFKTFDYVEDFHFIHAYYAQSVAEDVNTGLNYVDLPTVPFALPENRGVKEIYPSKNINNPYMPIAAGMVSFFKDALVGEVAYSIEKNRVYFHNMCNIPPSVTIKLVLVAPEELTDSEQFFLPYEFQEAVVVECLKVLGLENPEDKTNDSIEDKNPNQ